MSLEKIESYFGVSLPPDFCSSYSSGVSSDVHFLCSIEEMLELEHLTPLFPLRFLPFMTNIKGDVYGIYFPRDGGPAFAASIGISDGYTLPLTSDFTELLGNPEAYDQYDSEAVVCPTSDLLRSYKIDLNCVSISEVLLKPFSLNQFELDESSRSITRSILELSVEALGFELPFSEPIDVYRVENWLTFADCFLAESKPLEAFYCLENAHSLLVIPPHRGFPYKDNVNVFFEGSRLFSEMKKIDTFSFENQFNSVLIEFQCSTAKEWSSWPD